MMTLQRRRLLRAVEADPLFANTCDDIFADRVTRYRTALARARRVKELQAEMGLDEAGSLQLRAVAAFDDPTTLHELMFVPNIEALCSPEQQAEWLPRCRDWRVIGCYAQTEVGHGSNVRGIETTATFVPGADAFELHSPTETSTKFWPGSLGKTANHAMVIARLVLSGKDLGPHNFIVPLRDAEHRPLPGVKLGVGRIERPHSPLITS